MQFKELFGCCKFPVHSIIYRWVNKFRTHGTVNNLIVKTLTKNHTPDDRNHQGHHTTLLQSETLLSAAQASRFCDKVDAVPDLVDNVWFSDKAHFLLSGHVNNIFRSSTPPEQCLQRPLHSVKCTAWDAISKHGIIGPFWFEEGNERSVTINTERHVQVLGKFWTALGRQRGVVRILQWFQQDGATPHTSNKSLTWLQQFCSDGLISRRCDPEWSPHSPDLNPQILSVGIP